MKAGQSNKYDITKISDLFAAFGDPIHNHVDEDISSGATDSVAAVHNYQKENITFWYLCDSHFLE